MGFMTKLCRKGNNSTTAGLTAVLKLNMAVNNKSHSYVAYLYIRDPAFINGQWDYIQSAGIGALCFLLEHLECNKYSKLRWPRSPSSQTLILVHPPNARLRHDIRSCIDPDSKQLSCQFKNDLLSYR